MKLESPCAYQGGKQRIATDVVNILLKYANSDSHFYDLCCGSGAITIELIKQGVNPQNITMVDASTWGVFWNMIGTGTFDMKRFRECVDSVPTDITQIQSYIKELSKQPSNIDTAYVYLLLQSASFGSKAIWSKDDKWCNTSFRNHWLPTPTSNRKSHVNPMMPMPNTLYSRVENLYNNMIGVNGINDDLQNVIIRENAIVYIDPPYSNTTGYGFNFDVMSYIQSIPNNKVFVSEGYKMTDNAIQVTKDRKKGGISGERKSKNEEWVNIFN
jgi:site-specific DNA-adenine methylase